MNLLSWRRVPCCGVAGAVKQTIVVAPLVHVGCAFVIEKHCRYAVWPASVLTVNSCERFELFEGYINYFDLLVIVRWYFYRQVCLTIKFCGDTG